MSSVVRPFKLAHCDIASVIQAAAKLSLSSPRYRGTPNRRNSNRSFAWWNTSDHEIGNTIQGTILLISLSERKTLAARSMEWLGSPAPYCSMLVREGVACAMLIPAVDQNNVAVVGGGLSGCFGMKSEE